MKRLFFLIFLLSSASLTFALPATFTIDFEQQPAYTQITDQYSANYVTFQNALQLVAPSYDSFDYPPHSGSGVITNDPDDPIQINFTEPFAYWTVNSVSGWYSAPDGITVDAFDSDGNLLAVFAGADTSNSNAQFSVSSLTPIAWITLSANDGMDSETIDDLNYTVTPEPGSLSLLGSGALVLAGFLRRRFAC